MTNSANHSRDDDLLGDMGFLAEQLFMEGPFLMALVDPTLCYVRVSQRLAEVLGREVGSFPGKPVLKHGFSAEHKALMRQSLDANQVMVLKDWTARALGQKTRMPAYWHWTVVPLHDHRGQVHGLYLSGKDVTERRLLETEVIETAVHERREVSKLFHDNIGQLLAAITMKAKALAFKLDDQGVFGAEEVREIQDLATEVINSQRKVAKLLYPLEVEVGGLLNAIGNLADETSERYGVSCSVTAPDEEPDCLPVQAVHIYAIIKGITEHAVKQAGAQELAFVFAVEPEFFVLHVTHNGKAYKRTGTIRGYRMMTFHAHTIGGRLTEEGCTGNTVTFSGRFPRIIEEKE